MAALVTSTDIEYLRAVYPMIEFRPPDPQMEKAIMYYLRGMTIAQASRSAGYASGAKFNSFLETAGGKELLCYLRDREFSDIRITRDTLTSMFLDAYHQSATSMEKIAATRELGKLHGIYPDSKPAVQVNVSGSGNVVELNAKQLERLSDQDLLQMAPHLIDLLAPPVPIEGTSVRVLDSGLPVEEKIVNAS